MVRSPETGLAIRLMGSGIVLYWYYEIVKMFLQGGEEAPSLLFLILSGILMVGGAAAIGIMAYRIYKQEKAQREEAAQTEVPVEEDSEEEQL